MTVPLTSFKEKKNSNWWLMLSAERIIVVNNAGRAAAVREVGDQGDLDCAGERLICSFAAPRLAQSAREAIE
jgi:hypothetical protein